MQCSFDEYWKVIGPLRSEIETQAAVMGPLATIQCVVEQLQCTLLALRTNEGIPFHAREEAASRFARRAALPLDTTNLPIGGFLMMIEVPAPCG
jgi:hypothetical protein